MASRFADWYRQAERDLQHARHSVAASDFEWAAFAAQQGAEKAAKAAFQKLGMEGCGHAVSRILSQLPAGSEPPENLLDRAKRLDRHYILTRDPNGFDLGAPADFYTLSDATEAIADAEVILEFCKGLLGRS